ncbi:MAG: DMT family transporter [Chloroflexota bacterium]|nr:DMT family transporter [Chloroflexota bacterium]
MWIFLSLIASVNFAVVSVIDKRLLDRHLPSISVLYLWTIFGMLFWSFLILAITGLPLDSAPSTLLICLSSGLVLGVGIGSMFWGLKREEASRAIAIVNTNPVFVALLAIPIRGEYLSAVQWLALFLVIIGGTFISLRKSITSNIFGFSRYTPILIGSSICWGTAHMAAKYALEDLPLPTVFAIQQLGISLVLMCVTKKRAWSELRSCMHQTDTCVLMIIGEAILPYISIFLGLMAIKIGPVALVTSLLATRPMFVFLLASILSIKRLRIMDEPMTKGTLTTKMLAISMIIIGVTGLTIW